MSHDAKTVPVPVFVPDAKTVPVPVFVPVFMMRKPSPSRFSSGAKEGKGLSGREMM